METQLSSVEPLFVATTAETAIPALGELGQPSAQGFMEALRIAVVLEAQDEERNHQPDYRAGWRLPCVYQRQLTQHLGRGQGLSLSGGCQPATHAQGVDKEHGRIELRRLWLSGETDSLRVRG